MKAVLAAAAALCMLSAGAASAQPYRHHPHKVCTVHHHHRVCRWVH